MAYAAVVSLRHTIDGVLDSSPIANLPTLRKNLQLAHLVTNYFQRLLEKFNHLSSKRLDPLDTQIREAAHRLEDVLESHGLNYQDEAALFQRSYQDIQELNQEIISFNRSAKELTEYIEKFLDPVPEEEDDDEYVPSDIDDSGVEMVGGFTEVEGYLLRRMRPDDMCFLSYVGEAGTGRSVIGKALFEEEKQHFDCSAWVTVGARSREQCKEVVIRILDQVAAAGELLLYEEEEEEICNYLYKILEHRRYMIVLDDVRSVEVLDYLRSSFPDQSNGSLVFLTTHQNEIPHSAAQSIHVSRARTAYFETLPWQYLHWAVFGSDAPISPEFSDAARKIHINCRGLCMVRAKALLYLLKTDKTPEQWRKIAADEENPIFMVEDEISEMCKIKSEVQSRNWDMYDKFALECISRWIDFSTILANMKRRMHPKRFFPKLKIISLWGMAGIGKTACAKKMFQDKSILSSFDHCVWLTLGPKYRAEKILMDILAQIYPSIGEMHMKEDDKLVRDLCVQLSSKRCLIVVDDLWSKKPLIHLKKVFPEVKGRALVTTRLYEGAKWGEDDIFHPMHLLDKEESWCLLRQKVFADGSCPFEFEKLGRKIAENCEGLPLLLLKVAEQLLKVDMDLQHWNDAASGRRSLVFKNAHDDIYQTLFPSYKDLPQHLKACFLYMGAFRKSYVISKSKLTSMLVAEGFLEPNLRGTKEYFVPEFLAELVGKSVVMDQQLHTNGQIKRCRLHCVFWHLCNTEAAKNQFFHAMDYYDDCSIETVESQRRLCIRNSVLLGMKDVQDSMASATSARSLLCVSPDHQYPVPICFGLKMMRVMHALAIRQYEFPVEVVKLHCLIYLALTCNGKLPTSISKLRKLQYLIVSRYIHTTSIPRLGRLQYLILGRHMNTKSTENSLLLPMEIWDMKELKHLQIMGGCLPNPKPGAGLPKLATLLDVSAQSCTREVLEMIPNLKRLGVRIELAPDDEGNAFHYLNNISRISGLESLRCVVVNPRFMSEVAPPPAPTSVFPSNLKRLSLGGFGYPWEHMRIIVKLSNLEELKLKSYAFRGPKWDLNDLNCGFNKLQLLSVEDTDLVYWELPLCLELKRLNIKHCYKLRELPTCLPLNSLRKIEIVDSSPSVVTWADQMRQKLESFQIEAQLIR